MTEPVAYMWKTEGGNVLGFQEYKENIPYPGYVTPLYTSEQLHPRVEMTQAEFDELEISLINAQFDYSELKKTIEIVPDMKWFVRNKEPEGENDDEYYLFLSGSNIDDLDYLVFDYAKTFDTKEEAELWVNPLTEAVQLPVEDE
ncbi:MAG: hypothetical protein ABF901_00905 [Leuconostoc suionicum]|uniref:hypothetical protein n=1 Tax=Leuconostoc suionicum TaxID=1511761 RepID=UPI0039ECAE0F